MKISRAVLRVLAIISPIIFGGLIQNICLDKPDNKALEVKYVDTSKVYVLDMTDNALYCLKVIIQSVEYEGISTDPDDNGNYYNGKLLGTMHGVSAAFFFALGTMNGQKNEEILENFRNITKEKAYKIIFSYVYDDKIKYMNKKMLFYRVMYAFYFGKEKMDFDIAENKKITLDSLYKIYMQPFNADEYGEIAQRNFELRLKYACAQQPKYCKGWERKYKEILQANQKDF